MLKYYINSIFRLVIFMQLDCEKPWLNGEEI